jgi:uncharacterized RDD family membrane protein YckC
MARAARGTRYLDTTIVQYDDDRQLIGEAVALDARPTGFVLGAAGLVIDAIIGYGVLLLVFWGLSALSVDAALTAALRVAALAVVLVGVPTCVEVLTRGRSLGRLAVGARIVRDDGGAEQLRHAFVRSLVGVVEIYLTVGGIAAVTGLLSPRARRLGDLLAGTYSQRTRVPAAPPGPAPTPPHLAAWAQLADAAPLPARLARRVAEFLRHAQTLTPDARLRIATQLAREASAFVSPLPNTDPESFLVAVAALRREREGAALRREETVRSSWQSELSAVPPGFPRR